MRRAHAQRVKTRCDVSYKTLSLIHIWWLTPVYQLICDLGQSGPSYSPFFTGVLPENYVQQPGQDRQHQGHGGEDQQGPPALGVRPLAQSAFCM